MRKSGSHGAIDASDVEKSLALRDVMEYAVKVTREVAAAKQMVSWRARPILLLLIAVPSLALSVYTFVARPAFIWGPNPAAVAPARHEANVKFAMYLLAERLEQYRQEQGALPDSLSDLGETWGSIGYRVLSDTVFELKSVETGMAIVFRSDQSVDAFLGKTATLIRRRRR